MVARHGRRSRLSRWAWTLAALVVAGAGAAIAVGADTTTTTSTTSSTLATTTTVPVTTTTTPSVVTLTAVGDTELGDTPDLPPHPQTYLAAVRSALAAPIEFGNLEGTMYDGLSASKCGADSTECYAFRVPTAYARIYRADGFTVLNSANNHSHDFGDAGAASTTAALHAAGIVQAGLPGQIGVVHVGGTSVAFVDFAPYSDTNDMLDPASAVALIRRAHRLADVVVVYMHSGAEGSSADHVTRQTEYYVGEDRGNPYQFAHLAIDAGADLVLASGPHVLRGMQFYRGHLIAYSLGDFANYYDFGGGGDLAYSAILRVTLSRTGAFVSARYTSVLLSPAGQPRLDPAHGAATFVNALSRSDFGASAALVTGGGAVVEPAAGR